MEQDDLYTVYENVRRIVRNPAEIMIDDHNHAAPPPANDGIEWIVIHDEDDNVDNLPLQFIPEDEYAEQDNVQVPRHLEGDVVSCGRVLADDLHMIFRCPVCLQIRLRLRILSDCDHASCFGCMQYLLRRYRAAERQCFQCRRHFDEEELITVQLLRQLHPQ